MKIIKEPFDFLVKYRFPILLFLIYIVFTNSFIHDSCIFELILGVPCPSCGITRAWISAFKFDFVNAFLYHPLFLIIPLIMIVIIYKDYKFINKVYNNNIFWITLIVLVIVVFILRMIFQFPNEVLKINENSLLQIIIRFFKKIFS